MDVVQAFGELVDPDGLIRIMRAHIAPLPMAVLGWSVAPTLYPALVFTPLVFWAAFLRGYVLTIALVILAWNASTVFLLASVSGTGALQLMTAWVAGFLLCIAARRNRSRNRQISELVEERNRKLAAATFELDRERLWRRASGGERSSSDDTTFSDRDNQIARDAILNKLMT